MSELILAFEDIIHGTANVYSSAFAELRLAEREAYAIQCIVEGISNVETVTVQLETSGDGRNWVNKNPTPEINAVSTPAGQVTASYGYDPGNFPALALVRVRITLGIVSTSVARVRVYVSQRSGNYILPSKLPGCMLWLRSDVGLTIAAGTVSSWADQSGNGNDAIQNTATQQPTYAQSDNAFAGLPSLGFDGSNDMLATSAFSIGAYTVFMICTGQGATPGYFWTRSTGAANSDTIYGTTTNTTEVTRAGTLSAYNDVGGWGQWGATAKVLIKQFDGTHLGHLVRLNATAIATNSVSANNPGTSTTSDSFVIAGRADGFLPAAFTVAEVALFNSSLPTFQIQALEEYARRRYKLAY